MGKEQTTIRLPSELLEQLKKQADDRDMSFNGYVNLLLANAAKKTSRHLL